MSLTQHVHSVHHSACRVGRTEFDNTCEQNNKVAVKGRVDVAGANLTTARKQSNKGSVDVAGLSLITDHIKEWISSLIRNDQMSLSIILHYILVMCLCVCVCELL